MIGDVLVGVGKEIWPGGSQGGVKETVLRSRVMCMIKNSCSGIRVGGCRMVEISGQSCVRVWL